jgi:hypothetical protein
MLPKPKKPTTCPGGPLLYNEFIRELNDAIVARRGNGKQVKYQPLKMKASKYWAAVKKEACTSGGIEYVKEQARKAAKLILRGYSSYNKTTPKALLLNSNFETRKVKKMPNAAAAAALETAAPAAAGNAFANNLNGLGLPGKPVRTKKVKKVKVMTPSAATAVTPGRGSPVLNEAAALAALEEVEAENSARRGNGNGNGLGSPAAAAASGSPAAAPAAAALENRGRAALNAAVVSALNRANGGNGAGGAGASPALGGLTPASAASSAGSTPAPRPAPGGAAARSPNSARSANGNANGNAAAYGYTNLGNYNANTGLRRIRAKNGEEYYMNDEHGIYGENGTAFIGTLKPGGNIEYP